MPPEYNFAIVDVFTDQPLTGNPLAVFPDAGDMDDETMQAIAREFQFSETTFVVPPRRPDAARRLRCFSPAAEVFGAGHNALGAWWLLAADGEIAVPNDGLLKQELGDQVLPVIVTSKEGRVLRVAMRQLTPTLTPLPTHRDALAHALGLSRNAMHSDLEPAVSSTGATRHLVAPVADLDALSRIRINPEALVTAAHQVGCEGCYAFCTASESDRTVAHARGFFPGIGISEDPATGSAAGPLGRYLAQRHLAPEQEWMVIVQGSHLRRHSHIEVYLDDEGVLVGGSCVIVAEGHFSAPCRDDSYETARGSRGRGRTSRHRISNTL